MMKLICVSEGFDHAGKAAVLELLRLPTCPAGLLTSGFFVAMVDGQRRGCQSVFANEFWHRACKTACLHCQYFELQKLARL